MASRTISRNENRRTGSGALGALPREVFDLVGPDTLTGEGLAAIWSEVLDKSIRYSGDDLDAMEKQMRAFAPGWLAYDMHPMLRRDQQDGATATTHDLQRLTAVLGHPPRAYRDFAETTAQGWRTAGRPRCSCPITRSRPRGRFRRRSTTRSPPIARWRRRAADLRWRETRRLHVWTGMTHVFPSNLALQAPCEALDHIGGFLRPHLSKLSVAERQ